MHSLIRLRHIVAVARSASFSVASEEVGISQPALSRSIQAFEEDYGLRLFDRGKGRVSLTPAGKLAVEHARSLLVSAGEFDRDMRLFGQGKAGRTGVGMGPLVASMLLPRLGASLMSRNPQLVLQTKVGPPDQMMDALFDGTIELIVANAAQLSDVPGVTQERLGVLSLAFVTRKDHPLAGARALTASQLDEFPAACPFDYAVESQSSSAGAFVCENFNILRAVVLETDCTWLVSPALIEADLDEGRLVKLDIAGPAFAETQTNLVYLRGRTRSPASLILAEEVRKLMSDLSSS